MAFAFASVNSISYIFQDTSLPIGIHVYGIYIYTYIWLVVYGKCRVYIPDMDGMVVRYRTSFFPIKKRITKLT